MPFFYRLQQLQRQIKSAGQRGLIPHDVSQQLVEAIVKVVDDKKQQMPEEGEKFIEYTSYFKKIYILLVFFFH